MFPQLLGAAAVMVIRVFVPLMPGMWRWLMAWTVVSVALVVVALL
jgi:hypothetical protein